MDRIVELTSIVQKEVEWYGNARAWKAKSYNVADHQRQIYAAIDVPDYPRKYPARIIVMARIVGDTVIIDEDLTDRPLWEALVQAGIPRDKIVLVYIGEEAPQS